MDSLNYIKSIVLLEEKFNIKFEDDYLDINQFKNIGDLVEYIKNSVNDKSENYNI